MSDFKDVSVGHLILRIVRAIVDRPDDVTIETVLAPDGGTFAIRVHPEDIGELIGKQGRNIKSIRLIVGGAGMKLRRRFMVAIPVDSD
jgi:predicted RNA-binding protein YlqC (UPF0109 family)